MKNILTSATKAEMEDAQKWFATGFGPTTGSTAPFSFIYGGRSSADLFKEWKIKRKVDKLDPDRTRHAVVYSDPKTGLEVHCRALTYHDYPVVEWTLHFKNTGAIDTPLLENIQAVDLRLERDDQREFLLHHNLGCPNKNDYALCETMLPPGALKRFGALTGRANDNDWSYFNLEFGKKGLILAVGWPGQWSAEFKRDDEGGLQIQAGQELTHFKLKPGEEVRSPLIVLQFWRGDWLRSQNIWRRWMKAHNLPRIDGQLPAPMLAACPTANSWGLVIGEADVKEYVDRYLARGIKLDLCWIDCGWYPLLPADKPSPFNTSKFDAWPSKVGTWEPDRQRYPNGLRGVADHVHKKKIKLSVWFEPERAHAGSWLDKNHPEWLLSCGQIDPYLKCEEKIFNLGNPQAWQWLVDHISGLLNSEGIDIYRQDFNTGPLKHWRNNDAVDRQGMTENKHVTGYLAYWDELRQRKPELMIDDCSSGGKRNDLESLRRSVPLWISDNPGNITGRQCQFYGLALWVPYFGNHPAQANRDTDPVDTYSFLSSVAPSLLLGYNMQRKDIDYKLIKKLAGWWRRIAPNLLGDFYPLLPYSESDEVWMAWQFNCPEEGTGVIQAFRRPQSVYETARFKLRGLEESCRYELERLDSGTIKKVAGKELMEQGLAIDIDSQPGAAVIAYKKLET